VSNSRGPLPDQKSEKTRKLAKKGVARALSLRELQPAHPRTVPDAPDEFDDVGIDAWHEAWSPPWVLESDRLTVLQLARVEQEAGEMRTKLAALGSVLVEPITNSRGDIVGKRAYANPAVRELRRCGAEAMQLRALLGMSPTNRARLGIQVLEVEKQKTALEELFESRAKRMGSVR
jgi:hypothetical protein